MKRHGIALAFGAVVISFSMLSVSVYAGGLKPQPKSQSQPQYIYPFPAYPNPFIQSLPNQSGESTFLAGIPWPSDGGATGASRIWGTVSNGLVALSIQSTQGGWGAVWELCPVDGGEWTRWPGPRLPVSALPENVYEVRVTTPSVSVPLPSFWVAWPCNAILPDRFTSAGAVHGEIMNRRGQLQLHVRGYAYDAIQAGLRGSNGVRQARLKIDGNWSSIALDEAGNFDVTVPIRHQPTGTHTVALYAADFAHATLALVDAEYVSEYGWPLAQTSGDDSGGFCIDSFEMGQGIFYPSGVAVAKPRLDATGLLVFDGSESVNAYFYRWTVEDLSSGAVYTKEGATVATEDLPAGFYKVTLDCTGDEYYYDLDGPPAERADAISSFHVVIPPRISLAARKAAGALHILWSPELVGGRSKWCIYLSGHVFDEIGTVIFGHTVSNLEAWATVNGERVDLKLDPSGSFLARYVAGVRPANVYDLVLTVKTLDDGKEYEVDRLHETRLTIFLPWLRRFIH